MNGKNGFEYPRYGKVDTKVDDRPCRFYYARSNVAPKSPVSPSKKNTPMRILFGSCFVYAIERHQ
jgi:hypothetical protein